MAVNIETIRSMKVSTGGTGMNRTTTVNNVTQSLLTSTSEQVEGYIDNLGGMFETGVAAVNYVDMTQANRYSKAG